MALDEAEMGILDPSGASDWTALHGAATREERLVSIYSIEYGLYGKEKNVCVMKAERDNDSRLNIYFL